MKLLKDRILVKMNPTQIENAAGIILPISFHEKNTGVVVLIGPEVEEIKVGDKVKKFNDVIGAEIVYEGEKVLILRESEDIDLIL